MRPRNPAPKNHIRRNLRPRNLLPHAIICTGLIVAGSMTLAQRQTPPKARYVMEVETLSGMSALAGGGAGRAMSAVFGGGNKDVRSMRLRLGSTLAANGAPTADHFFQPAAKLGKSVPLITPPDVPPGEWPRDMERPRGRLLLYWGCGASAAKGQPVVIDFAKVTAGQMPPNLFSVRVPRDPGPLKSNSRTFGEWPNVAKSKHLSSDSSLIGEHRIAGNYAPEMKFSLGQDFMAGLRAQTSEMPGGATNISWGSIPGATGYHAWTMGMTMGEDGKPRDMVWWSSSSAREFGGGLWDWLAPETVQRLIGQKIVMPPTQTSCTVPAEVKAAAPQFQMGNLVAYGPEANFAYPPKPADPRATWALEWTARVRYRAMTAWMLGMPGMPQNGEARQPAKKPCKPSIGGILRGKAC
jgi:hypothetical protein